jgi:hypothetical protein
MTLKELTLEHQYRLTERLGHLCEDGDPSLAQLAMAEAEAQAVVESLNKQSRKEKGYT